MTRIIDVVELAKVVRQYITILGDRDIVGGPVRSAELVEAGERLHVVIVLALPRGGRHFLVGAQDKLADVGRNGHQFLALNPADRARVHHLGKWAEESERERVGPQELPRMQGLFIGIINAGPEHLHRHVTSVAFSDHCAFARCRAQYEVSSRSG